MPTPGIVIVAGYVTLAILICGLIVRAIWPSLDRKAGVAKLVNAAGLNPVHSAGSNPAAGTKFEQAITNPLIGIVAGSFGAGLATAYLVYCLTQ